MLTYKKPIAYILRALLLAIALLSTMVDAQIIRPFNSRFSVNTNGDIAIAGNMTTHCQDTNPATGSPPNTANCNSSRTGGNFRNNDFTMNYVNIDPGAGRISSSRAFLNIPSGSTILWAGLYWGGSAAAAAGARNTMQLRTPAGTGYNSITASQFDTFNAGGGIGDTYAGFANVTSLVQAGGAGDYYGANVVTSTGATNKYGGWSLFVVYENFSLPLRNLSVFDGYIPLTLPIP
jgi:hypothetical protein